ncbi:SPFH domain-containing protein [Leptodesmis sp.]|uniref:SPFH domain-containing protein n=1 Tax=Leptodesmis sp. TaxID=3100501 RepID=UPI0040535215
MDSLIAIAALAVIGYMIGSVKVIPQGEEGVVQRLGRYQRSLKPGLNFVIPLLDSVLYLDTREQILDTKPQTVTTKDNVTFDVDAVLFWKILDAEKACYAIEDLEEGLKNLVLTTLRSEIGKMELKQTFSSRDEINRALLKQLDQATESWGVKVIRVEVQEIKLSDELRRKLEAEQIAASEKRAKISQAEGVVDSIKLISQALQEQGNTKQVLKYLLAQEYVKSNVELSKSENSKIIFLDPKSLDEAVTNLIGIQELEDQGGRTGNREA